MMTRWYPANDLWDVFSQFSRQASPLLRPFGPPLAASYPPINVWEDAENVYAESELPGLASEHLNVFVAEDNQLTIQGERQPTETKGSWHRRERGFGKFTRTLTLPAPVDAEKVSARYEQGVLFLTLPKSDTAKPRRITVKADNA